MSPPEGQDRLILLVFCLLAYAADNDNPQSQAMKRRASQPAAEDRRENYTRTRKNQMARCQAGQLPVSSPAIPEEDNSVDAITPLQEGMDLAVTFCLW